MAVELQFVCEKNISSQLIARVSFGHLSHVDALLPEGLLGARSDRVGGRPRGVQLRPHGYLKFSTRIVMRIPASLKQELAWREWQFNQVGKPYDWSCIWGFITGRDWRAPDSWICSEQQTVGLEEQELMQRAYLAANKVTPVALAFAVSGMKGVVVR